MSRFGFIFFYVLKAQAQKGLMKTEVIANHMLENIPYDQLQGIQIGMVAADAMTAEG
jgi:hypothetical protein